MIRFPKRYGHFIFGIIQSGYTCAVAAGIASGQFMYTGIFIGHWIKSRQVAIGVLTSGTAAIETGHDPGTDKP